jgi:hypothetical protein
MRPFVVSRAILVPRQTDFDWLLDAGSGPALL